MDIHNRISKTRQDFFWLNKIWKSTQNVKRTQILSIQCLCQISAAIWLQNLKSNKKYYKVLEIAIIIQILRVTHEKRR